MSALAADIGDPIVARRRRMPVAHSSKHFGDRRDHQAEPVELVDEITRGGRAASR